MAKQYKNVYTILEKVKKGEIQSHYKDKEGLFGKINFYKKPDLVKPHLHYLDEQRIENIMDIHIGDQNEVKKVFQQFTSSYDYRSKIPDDKKPDFNQFYKTMTDIYNKKFPKHLVKDIFKMYYNKIEKLDFEDRTDKNYSQFKFLEKANNPVGKIMSENSQLKSAIFSKNAVSYFISQLAIMQYVDPDKAKDMMDNIKDSSESNPDDLDKMMDDMTGTALSKKMFDQAMQDAQQTCKMLDETLDADQQDEMFEAASSNKNAGKISKDYIDNITKRIQRISLSMNGVKDRIKKLLDKSASYFSAKDEVVYEDLFNATNVSEIDDYLFLHPKLRKIMVEDVQVKEVKKVGKIDLYIDISGSMDSDSGLKDANGGYMDKLEFCKAFAFKLAEMDMLNKLYLFESYVKEHKTDPISIAMIRSQGGTDIDAAVRSVLNNGNNAIIITDAEDACSIYSEKAFFIGVKGCRFTSFNTDTIKEYSDKDQVIMFDGNKVFKIGERGQVLK